MGIDGIGKLSGNAGTMVPTVSDTRVNETPESLPVGSAREVEAVVQSSPLDQLCRGDISVEQYLDIKVDEALAGVAQSLAPEKLSFIRSALRSQLATDPSMVELFRRATGNTPPSDERG